MAHNDFYHRVRMRRVVYTELDSMSEMTYLVAE